MSNFRGAYTQGGLTARPGSSFGMGGATSAGDVQLQMPSDFDVDDEVDKLHGKVSMLKQMTGAIHEESSIRGKLIDQLEETMANAGTMMKDAKKKLDKAFKQSKSWHMTYLLCFCLMIFLVYYMLYKLGRFVRFFTG